MRFRFQLLLKSLAVAAKGMFIRKDMLVQFFLRDLTVVLLSVLSITPGGSLNLADTPCGTAKAGLPSGHYYHRIPKIVGGVAALPGEYPWIVSIKWAYGSHFCGGTIVDRRHIISAAHCFHDFTLRTQEPSAMEVTIGEHLQNGLEQPVDSIRIKVQSIRLHPAYKAESKLNDIAVLTLQDNITWSSTVQPACLPDPSQFQPPNTGITAGWGATDTFRSSSDVLRKVQVPIWNNDTCLKLLRNRLNYNGNGSEQMCAGGRNLKDSCDGDSGSPLMALYTNQLHVVGIVSGGLVLECGKPGLPSLYTRVANYINWIQQSLV